MEMNYGIKEAELQMILDRYVLNQGDTMDVERLREGLKELIHKNNEALMNQIKELFDAKS
jgi:hypothetical protein